MPVMRAQGIGVGQTWQNVTRAMNTTYTNTTGRPILVFACVSGSNTGGAASVRVLVNAVEMGTAILTESNGASWNNGRQTFSFAVPPGQTYRIEDAALTSALTRCMEFKT